MLPPRVRAEQLYRLYAIGLSLREVGEIIGVTRQRIHQLFGKYSFALRKQTMSSKVVARRNKPYCIHGHPRTLENLNKYRQCIICLRHNEASYQRRKHPELVTT